MFINNEKENVKKPENDSNENQLHINQDANDNKYF